MLYIPHLYYYFLYMTSIIRIPLKKNDNGIYRKKDEKFHIAKLMSDSSPSGFMIYLKYG